MDPSATYYTHRDFGYVFRLDASHRRASVLRTVAQDDERQVHDSARIEAIAAALRWLEDLEKRGARLARPVT